MKPGFSNYDWSRKTGQFIGIREPWKVDRVDLDLKQGEVNVYLTHGVGSEWPCPEYGTPCPLYDHQPRRRWRHLDTCQLRTILSAEPPRSNCPEHGVQTVKLPWDEPGSRFTALFEALAIHWLRAASQKTVAERLGLSWDEVHAIQDRAVKRGLARRKAEPVARLGVDEKSFTRGHHGSWLKQAEIELSLISRQWLIKRRIPTFEWLSETRAERFYAVRNQSWPHRGFSLTLRGTSDLNASAHDKKSQTRYPHESKGLERGFRRGDLNEKRLERVILRR